VWFHRTHCYFYFRGNSAQPAVILPSEPGHEDFEVAAKLAKNPNRGWERLIAKQAAELTGKPRGMN
jgi:hypothetical protein